MNILLLRVITGTLEDISFVMMDTLENIEKYLIEREDDKEGARAYYHGFLTVTPSMKCNTFAYTYSSSYHKDEGYLIIQL